MAEIPLDDLLTEELDHRALEEGPAGDILLTIANEKINIGVHPNTFGTLISKNK